MRLKDLMQGAEVLEWHADAELDIAGVSYDSRLTRPGDAFVAICGYAMDGHGYIPAAVGAGAVCAVCQRPPEGDVPYVLVRESRRALAVMGANWFGHPAEAMTMVGVTGTNGKTTTTYLLKAVLEHTGAKVGLIGTNQNLIGDQALETERTTPECFELHKLFARMRDAGCTHVVMEVSSHALEEGRVHGIFYDVGIFTNLTQDHLDFHQTMERYCDAKAILFQNCRAGVYNADDPWARRLTAGAKCALFSFGETAEAVDLWAEDIALSAEGIDFAAAAKGRRTQIRVGIPGGFMVYNTLGVLAAALQLGIPLETGAQALATASHVKGRVEVVPTPGKDYTILIDYAHSPDGLENVLRSVKGFAKGRTVAVFGCGGDRDRTKRPKMGRIAADIADFAVVTSDNPRTEVPGDIIREILTGMEGTGTPYAVVEDRVEAIHYAMDHAEKGDVIVLCGKGHETYQVVGTEKRHLDEREVVADWLGRH